MSSDLDLAHRYAETRDAEAFSALVGKYQDFVYAVCLRILGNPSDAEDVVPPEVRAAGPEAVGAWFGEFLKTDQGRAYQEIARSYPVTVKADGSFRVEDVPPGKYGFQALAVHLTWVVQPIAMVSLTVEVPKTSGRVVDLGRIEMQPATIRESP